VLDYFAVFEVLRVPIYKVNLINIIARN